MRKNLPPWLKHRIRANFEGLAIGQQAAALDLRFRGVTPFWRGWWLVDFALSGIPQSGFLELEVRGRSDRGRNRVMTVKVPISSARRSKRLFYADWQIREMIVHPLPDGQALSIDRLSLAPALRSFAVRHIHGMLAAGSRDLRGRPLKDLSHLMPSVSGNNQRPSDQQLSQFLDEAVRDALEGEATLYQRWIRFREPQLLRNDRADLAGGAKLSVVMPVHNPPEAHLRGAIESVIRQTYPNWELCIADDASSKAYVRPVIEEYLAHDKRLKAVFLEQHNHISRTTNQALAMADGDFVAFLDHDDELSPYALQEVALAVLGDPQLDIVYSDEDFLDPSGERCTPHFKSDWNPYLLYSHNYVTHLCVYRRELVERVGGLRAGVEGAQDYDLLLRCSRETEAARIHHIPKVLYHWRMSATSTAASADNKAYTHKAGRKVLQDYFAHSAVPVDVRSAGPENFYRVMFNHPRPDPLVTLIIPTRDQVDLLRQCVDGLLNRTSYQPVEILVVDNESGRPDTLSYLREIDELQAVRVIRFEEPFNFARLCNFAATQANGEVLGFLNNDTDVINSDWLDEMVMLARRPEVGCVGAKLLYADETVQHAGVILGLGGYAAHSHRCAPSGDGGYFNRLKVRQNVSAVTAACLVVRKSVYQEVDGMDERFTVAYNDVDFCLRVRAAGYVNVFTPFAELYHFESKTRGYEDTAEKQARFQREKDTLEQKWGDRIRLDPYYNPNLTHSREDFSIAL